MADAKRAAKWDLADLTTSAELARHYGMTRRGVGMWSSRYPDFPKPLIVIGQVRLYSHKEVARWVYRRWPA